MSRLKQKLDACKDCIGKTELWQLFLTWRCFGMGQTANRRSPCQLNKKPFATVPGRENPSGLLKTPKISHLVHEFPESAIPSSWEDTWRGNLKRTLALLLWPSVSRAQGRTALLFHTYQGGGTGSIFPTFIWSPISDFQGKVRAEARKPIW